MSRVGAPEMNESHGGTFRRAKPTSPLVLLTWSLRMGVATEGSRDADQVMFEVMK